MKHHTIEKRVKVFESINLGQLLESTKATTIAGDKLHSFLVENHNSQKLNSVSAMLSVASHCAASKDANMINVGSVVVESIKDSIDARLIYCLESVLQLHTFDQNSLAKQLAERLETIIEMEDVNEQLNAIRSGALASFKTVTNLVDWVHEAAKVKTNEVVSEDVYHRAFHPITYIEEGQQNEIVLKLGNKVFAIGESFVHETVSTSPKFSYLSSIVENLTFDHNENVFIHTDEKLGQFKINESGVYRNTDMIVEAFDQATFIKEMGIICESLSSNQNEAYRNQQVVDAMLSIQHNYSNIVLADNILMVENLRNNEKYAVIVANENASFVSTISSLRYPQTTVKFKRVDEAIEFVKQRSGFDGSEFFTKYISEQHASDASSTMISEKYNDILETLESKEQDIKNKITEAKSELRFNKVKVLEESLIMTQSLIIEQKQNFAKHFAK